MDQGVIHYMKSKYRKHMPRQMTLCPEVGKLYEVDLLGVVHLLAHVWKNTAPQVITNCFWHSGFMRPEHVAAAKEVSAESTNDECPNFDAVLPMDVTLRDYIVIDHGVATNGLPTNEEIINDVAGAQEGHDSGEGSCEEVQPRPHHTSIEVTDVLFVSENICLSTSNSLHAVGRLKELRKKLMSAGICVKKQTTIAKHFSKQMYAS